MLNLIGILKAVEKHKQSKQWKDGIYPHASTWLNQRRWEDEIFVEKIEQVKFYMIGQDEV
jgi:hypothetical protein